MVRQPLIFDNSYNDCLDKLTFANYLFYIMSTIAGNYFGTSGKIKPARVMVNRQFVRAYPGGLGETKTAANYAASIWPQKMAADKECDQVLFLDALKHDYIDEMEFDLKNGHK